MDEVRITIAERDYVIACEKEDAPQVRSLAAEIDREVNSIEKKAGMTRAILIAALTMVDRERMRLREASKRVEAVAKRIEEFAGALPNGTEPPKNSKNSVAHQPRED